MKKIILIMLIVVFLLGLSATALADQPVPFTDGPIQAQLVDPYHATLFLEPGPVMVPVDNVRVVPGGGAPALVVAGHQFVVTGGPITVQFPGGGTAPWLNVGFGEGPWVIPPK